MKVFFQIKFSITAKEETQIEEELSNYVLTWLESKYGVAAKRAISACKSLLSDSEFGDPNGLFVETVHYEDVKYAQCRTGSCYNACGVSVLRPHSQRSNPNCRSLWAGYC